MMLRLAIVYICGAINFRNLTVVTYCRPGLVAKVNLHIYLRCMEFKNLGIVISLL